MGWTPETVDPGSADALVGGVRETKVLPLSGGVSIDFNETRDLIFRKGDFHPGHPNTVSFTAFTRETTVSRTFFSVGGGAIVEEGERRPSNAARDEPYPFSSAADLLSIGRNERVTFAQLVLNNEKMLRSEGETFEFLDKVRDAMMGCIERGCAMDGILPDGRVPAWRPQRQTKGNVTSS